MLWMCDNCYDVDILGNDEEGLLEFHKCKFELNAT